MVGQGMTRGSTIRVLHVDDDACILEISKLILEMKGAYQVETASSVDEAFEKMGENEYDVVVSDYQMPGKDGLQFLKELREKGNRISFVFIVGKAGMRLPSKKQIASFFCKGPIRWSLTGTVFPNPLASLHTPLCDCGTTATQV
jgi:DNA-binding NtrC family response regulator